MQHEAKEYLDEIMEQLGGKGGGSKDVYTGGIINVENPKLVFEELVNAVVNKLQNNESLN